MDDKKVPNSSGTFCCKICDYTTSRKSQYTRHTLSAKHKNATIFLQTTTNVLSCCKYKCSCGKSYKHRASLHKHKQTCNLSVEPTIEARTEVSTETANELKYIDLVLKLINENKELKDIIVKQNTDLQKTITDLIPNIGSNNNNNINQKININMFLNEECKDAMTIEHFVDNIKVSMANVFLTKNKGIDEGISNIFIENINKLSLHERPIHCTDTKRDIVYIKSDGKNGSDAQWSKDTDNEKFKGAIKVVERKQHKNIQLWMAEHPGWESNTSLQEEYLDLMRSCTSDVKEQKIIKKVCNTVKIESEN